MARAPQSSWAPASGRAKQQWQISSYLFYYHFINTGISKSSAEQTKLFLGEKTYNVYNNAISTAIKLYEITKNEQYKEKAFLFSEKSKTNILLESLSEAKAKQFAGIPETLLEHERQVKIDIESY